MSFSSMGPRWTPRRLLDRFWEGLGRIWGGFGEGFGQHFGGFGCFCVGCGQLLDAFGKMWPCCGKAYKLDPRADPRSVTIIQTLVVTILGKARLLNVVPKHDSKSGCPSITCRSDTMKPLHSPYYFPGIGNGLQEQLTYTHRLQARRWKLSARVALKTRQGGFNSQRSYIEKSLSGSIIK